MGLENGHHPLGVAGRGERAALTHQMGPASRWRRPRWDGGHSPSTSMPVRQRVSQAAPGETERFNRDGSNQRRSRPCNRQGSQGAVAIAESCWRRQGHGERGPTSDPDYRNQQQVRPPWARRLRAAKSTFKRSIDTARAEFSQRTIGFVRQTKAQRRWGEKLIRSDKASRLGYGRCDPASSW